MRSHAALKAWMLVIGASAVVPAIAFLATWRIGCGMDINPAFFATSGQIGPVFGLALFVEIAVVMTPVVQSQGATEAVRGTVQSLVRTNAAMLVISEAAALYSVASSTTTLFLVICVVLPWVIQLILIVDTAYYRIGLHRVARRK